MWELVHLPEVVMQFQVGCGTSSLIHRAYNVRTLAELRIEKAIEHFPQRGGMMKIIQD